MTKRVRLFGISKGDAGVRVDGEYIGDATHTDEGTWWSAFRTDDGDRDILEDHRTRREAVARLVEEHGKRRGLGVSGAALAARGAERRRQRQRRQRREAR